MSLPQIVSREEWLDARKELLRREKAHKKQSDVLNTARRNLPMVKLEKDYKFEGENGTVSLGDLFQGRPQLVVQHVMFHPDWEDACPACTASVDEISPGLLRHLNGRRTTFAAVSRARLAKLTAYKAARGWFIDWYSSHDSDFNYDFHVTIDAAVAPVLFNYRDSDELKIAGMEWLTQPENHPSEQSGVSFFLRSGDDIFHTYSTFGRGAEASVGAYSVLDLTALGRQEDWEEPKGRVEDPREAVPIFD
jgi:predicted dithiol-disulfide oxidoreductase (DUF899 family)